MKRISLTPDQLEKCVLFEDNHLLVINKPPGIAVQNDGRLTTTLHALAKQYLVQKYQKPGKAYLGLVHRLDQGVSGVITFAKTSKCASRLSLEFRERRVKKIYLALVAGYVQKTSGHLRHHLVKEKKKALVTTSANTSAHAVHLEYQTLETSPTQSLLQIRLHTGFYHQIRAQLADFDHPVLSDKKYGTPSKPEYPGIYLHAVSLQFSHPVSGKVCHFIAYPPAKWDLHKKRIDALFAKC